MAETWWDYVQRISGTDNQSEIARSVGVGQASVNRWRDRRPSTENARAFAIAYERPVLEAYEAAGLLEPGDVNGQPHSPSTSIDDLPNLLRQVEATKEERREMEQALQPIIELIRMRRAERARRKNGA